VITWIATGPAPIVQTYWAVHMWTSSFFLNIAVAFWAHVNFNVACEIRVITFSVVKSILALDTRYFST
jgi:hypothetical protein